MTALYIGLALLVNGCAGLAGGLLPSRFMKKHHKPVLAFAAGTLLGVAFLDLIPESLAQAHSSKTLMIVTLSGFLLFHIIEQFLGSHAVGSTNHNHQPHAHSHAPVGAFLLAGDALHNMTDGAAIAAAFLVSPELGLLTTVAVLLHELPQEIGDFAILVDHGYSRARALTLLACVQLTSVLGAVAVVVAASFIESALPYITGFAAGGFIYIAAAHVLPELRNKKSGDKDRSMVSVAALVLGILTMSLMGLMHSHDTHSPSHHDHEASDDHDL
jgi:zinc and cadmium transporter